MFALVQSSGLCVDSGISEVSRQRIQNAASVVKSFALEASEFPVASAPVPRSWEINGDSTQVKSPSYTFEKQGLFPVTLFVTNKWNCKDTLTKIIKVENEFIFWLPNSFTPNGDGLNDVLRPKYFGIKNYSISIFDRWGSEIYSGNDQSKEWDGTFKGVICQDGVYVYQATIIDNRMIRHNKVGHVTLLK